MNPSPHFQPYSFPVSSLLSPISRFLPALALLVLVTTAAQAADDAWPVPAATVRFRVHPDAPPTHPSAGYFLQLPDGGILPGPKPGLRVLDARGADLKVGILWQNRESGLGLVFEAPTQGGDVVVYVEPTAQMKLWTPASGLTPSALLCTMPGATGPQDAQRLAKLGEVGPAVHYRNRAGEGRAPLSVPGDLSGRSGPCAIYLQAYLAPAQAGDTWFAPIIFDGQAEVRVDGQALRLQKVSGKPGGTGESRPLTAGLHRLEILCWTRESNAQNGLMTLTWRTPDTNAKEMGGLRPSDLPGAGTPMWDSRPLRANEIVRSGQASVLAAERRDGGPVARVAVEPVENFWLENESPLLVYKLAALEAGNPAGTRYTWNIGRGGRSAKPELTWLFPGGREQKVELTATFGEKRSTCILPFYPFTANRTDLNQFT
jgi:hypothetical protein